MTTIPITSDSVQVEARQSPNV